MKHIFLVVIATYLITACQPKDTNPDTQVVEADQTNTESNNHPPKDKVLKPCTKDAKMCPNGKSVGRDSANNCEFYTCNEYIKKKNSVMCTADVKQCPDGTFVGRDHKNNCRFKQCPE